MQTQKINTIVLDMGQVLIHWKPGWVMENFHLNASQEALLQRELFASVEWVRFDRGTITPAEMIASVNRRLPQELHPCVENIVTGWWQRPLCPMEGMGELIRELKALGYGIYLLSNASLDLRKYFHRIPGSECFDGMMVSAEEKLIKPQPEIYRALYARFSLDPQRSLFIDDQPANIEAAMYTGMDGILFRGDTAALRRELNEKGIPVAQI